jgi:uracil-DNA glycosylase
MRDVNIKKTWEKNLQKYLETESFESLLDFVENEYQTTIVYPDFDNIFKAFSLTPFSQIKVVVLGQDPYHGPQQAHGLSFSVPIGVTPPPSLKNIYREIESDLNIAKDMSSGNLEPWAEQGVLLLNSILTVRAGEPASHHKKGWEDFTDHVITTISEKHEHVVFILWGKYAQGKADLIDASKHLVLTAAHPSPFSAHHGFFGCKHFSKCNTYLKKYGKEKIIW